MIKPTRTKRLAAASILAAALVAFAVAVGAHVVGPSTPVAIQPVPQPKPAASKPVAIKPATVKPAAQSIRAPTPTPEPLVVRSILDTGGPIRYGKWFWDESAAPPSTSGATGTMIVTIDLTASVLSAFRDGHEIGTSAIIRGFDGKDTPLGVFPITQKDADHRSRTYGGAPMPYMLRLTADGVSIHGSAKIAYDAATHGCVGVPVAFAKKLFGVMKLGDRVIITQGRTIGMGDAIAR